MIPPAQRCRARLRRYAALEAAGIIGALAAALPTHTATGSLAAAAAAGTVGELVGFYGWAFLLALRACPAAQFPSPRIRLRLVTAAVAAEFGPAEILDFFLVRPAFMYAGPLLVGGVMAGLVLGKIAADVVFYTAAALTVSALARRRSDARAG